MNNKENKLIQLTEEERALLSEAKKIEQIISAQKAFELRELESLSNKQRITFI